MKDTSQIEIYLIRHAKVAMKKPFLCTSRKAADLLEKYDVLPVYEFDPSPVRELFDNEKFTVYTSALPRAIETACLLFPESDTLYSHFLFNEYDLSMISVPLLPLPYVVWTSLSRFFWTIALNNKGESRREARQRMKEATDQLVAHAMEKQHIVLVAHGLLISEMKHELKKRGWKLEFSQGHKNLAVAKLWRRSFTTS